MMEFNIGLFEKLSSKAMDFIEKNATVKILEDPYCWSFDEDFCSKIDALIIRAKGFVSKEIIHACPNLRIIARHGVGIDNIDVITANSKDIDVMYTPTANYNAVAEFIVGLMINLSRNIVQADNFTKKNMNWLRNHDLVGNELFGKNVGVIGAGRIGLRLAEIAATGFNMKVSVYDYKNRENCSLNKNITITDNLESIMQYSDFISINVPSNSNTKNMINKQLLELVKPKCCIVNTARGDVIDEEVLLDLLVDNKIGGVALDVYKNEPFRLTDKLINVGNFITTPHIGYLTHEAIDKMSDIAHDVLEGLKGNYNYNNLFKKDKNVLQSK